MQVNYHPPSDLDATVDVQAGTGKLHIAPKFYHPKGSSVVGTLRVVDNKGQVLDRVVLSVSGNGRVNLVHRNEEVIPLADKDKGGKQNGESAESKRGSGGRKSSAADAHPS